MAIPPPAPAYVQFHPTLRCNLACGFCFNRGLPALPDARLDDAERMLDRLREAGVTTLDLLGGEPTLHPRLADLVRAIMARGMTTTLSTNGLGNLELLERIEDEVGRAAFRVGVSVNEEALPPPLRDYLARRRPMVKSVCTPEWSPAPAVAEHLGRAGAEFFLLYRDVVDAEELRHALSFPEFAVRLRELQREHPGSEGVFCGGFVPDLAAHPALAAARCPAGTTKLSVLPDGSAYPCYLLFRRPEFRLGNVYTDSFERIWGHPALAFFREFRGNPCPRRECAHHAACHGGCPAVSLLIAGDIAAPDPRCG